MTDKKQVKQELALVRRLLLENWDPIGIKDEPGCTEEYDNYAPQVLALLRADADVDAVAAHLLEVERDAMGLHGSAMACRRSAVVLKTLWRDRQTKS